MIELSPGTMLQNRYSISREIARNEYAVVFKAFDIVADGTPVAVKMIRISEDSGGVALELFRREVESLTRLRHPNIVRLLDHGHDATYGHWLALEWMDGGSLQDERTRGRLQTVQALLSTTCSLLDALALAHLSQVLHRDIKPANILYSNDGVVKLADFNVSKIQRRATAIRTVRHIFSDAYASPEQRTGASLSERSDVFSLGKVIAELVTDEDSNSSVESLSKALDAASCPGPLRRLLRRMLSDKPTSRPTATEALREVQALLLSSRPMKNIAIRATDNVLQAVNQADGGQRTTHEQRMEIERDLAGPLLAKIRTQPSPKGGTTYTLYGRRRSYFAVATENDVGQVSALLLTSAQERDPSREDRERDDSVELPLTCRIAARDVHADFTGDADAFVSCHQSATAQRSQIRGESREARTQVKLWREYIGVIQEMRQREGVLGHVRSCRQRAADDLLELKLDRSGLDRTVFEEARITVESLAGGRPSALGFVVEVADATLVVRIDDNSPIELPIPVGARVLLDSRQEAASLRRQIAALNTLEDRGDVKGDLLELIVFPERARPSTPIRVHPKTADLDGTNREVVERALGTDRMFLVQGPPGTGKTTVIAELAAQILDREQHSRILLVSQANVAIDNVLERLDQLQPGVAAVRLGRADRVAPSVQHMQLDKKLMEEAQAVRQRAGNAFQLLNVLPGRVESLSALQELWTLARTTAADKIEVRRMADDVLGETAAVSDHDLAERLFVARELASKPEEWQTARRLLQDQWRARLDRLGELETVLFANMRIVAGTCVGVVSSRAVADQTFDWVIVDEAGRATAPELLVPLVRGERIVLVGDHRQLPPILDREALDEIYERGGVSREHFERSQFESLFNGLPDGARARLTKQYRMHPTVAGLIEQCFYPEGLGNGVDAKERTLGFDLWDAPLRWFDTSALDALESKNGTSYTNSDEVKLIVFDVNRTVSKAQEAGHKTLHIGVLSAYARQVEALASALDELVLPKGYRIEVLSVDASQGREFDLVYYSTVRANRHGRIGFLADERRLNVALSRAKHGLTIVGHRQSLREADARFGQNPFLPIDRYLSDRSNDRVILSVGRK